MHPPPSCVRTSVYRARNGNKGKEKKTTEYCTQPASSTTSFHVSTARTKYTKLNRWVRAKRPRSLCSYFHVIPTMHPSGGTEGGEAGRLQAVETEPLPSLNFWIIDPPIYPHTYTHASPYLNSGSNLTTLPTAHETDTGFLLCSLSSWMMMMGGVLCSVLTCVVDGGRPLRHVFTYCIFKGSL